LLGWSMIKVLATGYYAKQNTKGPVKVAMRALGLTMILNVIVVALLAFTGNLKTPGAHALLALSNGVGAMLNAGLLYTGLIRSQVLRRGQALRGLLIRIVVASTLMAAFLWWFGGDLATWLVTSKINRVFWLTGLVAGGIAIYFGALWLMGVRTRQFRLQPPSTSL
jgi:putative peptidoglycan lipid II flippase